MLHEAVRKQVTIGTAVGAVDITPLLRDDERHSFVESLRSLRSSLLFLPFEGPPPRSFLITSAVPNEGKSTVALNFAITMAMFDVRVLLVDGDESLRRALARRSRPCSSPLCSRTVPASTTVEKNGAGNSARPISSSTMPSSTNP